MFISCKTVKSKIHTHTSVYHVLQSQKIATRYTNNKIHQEVVRIDINAAPGIQSNKMIKLYHDCRFVLTFTPVFADWE